jgi:hypothetical protein
LTEFIVKADWGDTFRPRTGLLTAATALFVVFISAVFLFMACPCALDVYQRYARIARGESLVRLYETCNVEYPPLAVELFVVMDQLAARASVPAFLSSIKTYQQESADSLPFKLVWRLAMVACTFVTWAVIIVLLYKNFQHESTGEWAERLLAFGLALWPLGYVMLDRLDMGLSCLIMLALVLLLNRKHFAGSLAFLAAAVALKVVPLALVPIWLITSQPGSNICNMASVRGLGRFVIACLVRSAIFTGMLAVFVAPTWLLVGKSCLSFFSYHKARGIELESNYAAILTLLKHVGYTVRTRSGWGSTDLHCSVAPLLSQLSAVLVTSFLALGALVLLASVARRGSSMSSSTVANTDSTLILGHVLWALLVFVLFNKTFSPQYVVWLVPLAAVVPLQGLRRRLFQLGFLGVAFTTMLIFPRCFSSIRGIPLPTDPTESTGASIFGTGLLLFRLLLLLLLAASLTSYLLRCAWRPQAVENNLKGVSLSRQAA